MEQCCDHQPTKMESQHNNLVNLVGYISLTHATALHPLSTVVCSASWQQIPH